MPLPIDKLPSQLKQGLAPIYLISGDVPLLIQESCDAIRSAARKVGCEERIILHVEKGFDWSELTQHSHALSLFSSRRLIECHLPTGKPGDAGSKALQSYVSEAGTDDVLLIIAGKLDSRAKTTKWFKAIDKVGVIVQVWPPEGGQFNQWIKTRMQSMGLQPSPGAISLLAERSEGNLLACHQEIEKLALLYDKSPIDEETMLDAITDSARYSVYSLVDSALEGNGPRTIKMLQGLKDEGVEPVIILWALTREIRSLANMSYKMQSGLSAEQVMGQYYVWQKRKPCVGRALTRHNVYRWWRISQRAARVERTLKGILIGNVWDELLQLSLIMAGINIVRAA